MDVKGLKLTKYLFFNKVSVQNISNSQKDNFQIEKGLESPSLNFLENTLSPQASSIKEDNQEWRTLLEKIKETLFSLNKALEIEIDEELKIPIYKIIDLKTKEVLKQIPLEDILKFKRALAKYLQEELEGKREISGLILNKEV
ncbi:MAG: flagellar protein FlaG [Caldimicrobium sp.]